MKKLIYSLLTALLLVAAAVVLHKTNTGDQELFQANVEALTAVEQPNVKDCIEDPNYDCEALHPTDPSKDQYRQHARW